MACPADLDNQGAGFKEIDSVPDLRGEREVADVNLRAAGQVEMPHWSCWVGRRDAGAEWTGGSGRHGGWVEGSAREEEGAGRGGPDISPALCRGTTDSNLMLVGEAIETEVLHLL
jgi:hypothetical protein